MDVDDESSYKPAVVIHLPSSYCGNFHSWKPPFSDFPMVFRWFSHGSPVVFPWFPVVFRWFSHGFPMVFLWFSMVFLWFSYGFPMVLLWFSYGSPWFSHGFPVVLHGFPVVFRWFSHGFPMVFLWFPFGSTYHDWKPGPWVRISSALEPGGIPGSRLRVTRNIGGVHFLEEQ